MVIVQIMGGLGNQMFQYAAARRMAWFLNTSLKLDVTLYQYDRLRVYGLHHFEISGEIASEEEIVWIKCINHLKEKDYYFEPMLMNLPAGSQDVYLEGYWQSEKYFGDIEQIIRREFRLKEPLNLQNHDFAQQIQESEAVSIHIRRGDYVMNPAVHFLHGVCPLDYYYQAVDKLARQIGKPHFFVFSDDEQWGRENLKLNYPVTFIDINGPEQDYNDLWLMTLCKHHIIANSSFSWWGAWLSDKPQKLVFAPRRWFNGYPYDTRDLIPETWYLI